MSRHATNPGVPRGVSAVLALARDAMSQDYERDAICRRRRQSTYSEVASSTAQGVISDDCRLLGQCAAAKDAHTADPVIRSRGRNRASLKFSGSGGEAGSIDCAVRNHVHTGGELLDVFLHTINLAQIDLEEI